MKKAKKNAEKCTTEKKSSSTSSFPILSILKLPYSLPILSGILLILIQPPISLFFLAYIALVPLLLSFKEGNLRQSFFSGYVAGVVSYSGLVYWTVIAMNRYGGIPMVLSVFALLLLVLYLSLYTGTFSLMTVFLEKRFSIPLYFSAPMVWVLLEYIRGVALTGFPWSLLAYSQYNFLPLIQVVSITGTYFISFLIVSMNCILFYFWRKKSISYTFIVIICIVFIASFVYGLKDYSTHREEKLNVSIIQGNISQDIKWSQAQMLKIVRTYYDKTLEAGKNTHLFIWPETALPFSFEQIPSISAPIKALPSITGGYLLIGTVSKDTKGRSYNSAYVISNNNETVGIYNKVHLVPFGEYTPFRTYFPFLERVSVAGGEFFSGEGHIPIKTVIGNIGVLICYEGIFPAITNETVRRGAEVFVNITNDAWFGKTSAPYQHLAFYIFRAIETDRYVLRSANTGISAIIDPRGRVQSRTELFERAILKGTFDMKQTKTIYARHGDYFVLFIFLLLLSVVIFKIASGWSRRG